MEYLLKHRLKGSRQTKVKEHTKRAKRIAGVIWTRFQVGPYQYQVKHLRWYLNTQTQHLTANTRYRHWLTIKYVVISRGKGTDWIVQLKGSWMSSEAPISEQRLSLE